MSDADDVAPAFAMDTGNHARWLMAEEHRAPGLRKQCPGKAPENPFLHPAVAISARDDEVRLLPVGEIQELIGARGMLVLDVHTGRGSNPVKEEMLGDIGEAGSRSGRVVLALDDLDQLDCLGHLEERNRIAEGSPCLARVLPRHYNCRCVQRARLLGGDKDRAAGLKDQGAGRGGFIAGTDGGFGW